MSIPNQIPKRHHNPFITSSTSLLNPHPRPLPRLHQTPRLPLLLPTPILVVHRMPTLRLRRTLRHATRERARVRRARVRRSLRRICRAADFEVFAVGVVGLAVFGGAEGGSSSGGGFDGAGVGRGGEGPFVEEVEDCC